jgi:hypothetical protein
MANGDADPEAFDFQQNISKLTAAMSKGLALAVQSVRPALAHFYVQAKALEALSIGARTREAGKSEDASRFPFNPIGLVAFQFYSYSETQQMIAESHATALFLNVDAIFQQMRKAGGTWNRDFGPEYCGYSLSAIVRAVTAQIRHRHNWQNDSPESEAKVLRKIGVANITDPSVPLKVLNIIGRDDYFAFEDDLLITVLEIIQSASGMQWLQNHVTEIP